VEGEESGGQVPGVRHLLPPGLILQGHLACSHCQVQRSLRQSRNGKTFFGSKAFVSCLRSKKRRTFVFNHDFFAQLLSNRFVFSSLLKNLD